MRDICSVRRPGSFGAANGPRLVASGVRGKPPGGALIHCRLRQPAGCRGKVRGRHRGYMRLPQPVVVERTFTLSRRDGALTIADVLDGEGTHRIRWHFHFAPEVEVTIAGGDRIEIRAGATMLEMSIAASL